MGKRSCPFCGKSVAESLNRCPYCREAISPVAAASGSRKGSTESQTYVRRGLLWAMLAAVLYYFAGGHSGLTLPFAVPPFVMLYFVPLMFLAAVSMALYGAYLRFKS
jgi:hypothetical protein